MNNTFIAIPSHNGQIEGELLSSVLDAGSGGEQICICVQRFSKLTQNFNLLWCEALNHKEKFGLTHFLLLHADIAPKAGWLNIMHREMKNSGAEVLSAVSPIKGRDGLTSTGLCHEETEPIKVKRFTLKEIHAMPETFTDPDLIINTGLMLVDLNAPWISQFKGFRVTDWIKKDASGPGLYRTGGAPEDWLFSLDIRKLGAKIFSTRAVTLSHIGQSAFSNQNKMGIENEDYKEW